MVKLLIIADDFTGALDTGVQFSSAGIRTKVIVDNHLEVKEDENYQVLVIDAETRHLTAEEAYRIVYSVVAAAKSAQIPYIYKKTDSALRGNIGSELVAAMDALEVPFAAFIPAFPRMRRVTRGGIHYIDEKPVSQSVFGIDPFEPVVKDSVKDIIHIQKDVYVTEVLESAKETAFSADGIAVFDAETDESILETADLLKKEGKCGLLAGCAGFAAILPELLELKGEELPEEKLESHLVVVCGSVNPITRKQLAYGKQIGYAKKDLVPEQKLNQEWWDTADGKNLVAEAKKDLETTECVIFDSNDLPGTNATMDYADANGITLEEVRVRISTTMGMAAKKLLEQEMDATYLITGGDTLMGLMRQIGCNGLVPINEIAPGSVLTRLTWNDKVYHIITKSGGFGEESLLKMILDKQNGR